MLNCGRYIPVCGIKTNGRRCNLKLDIRRKVLLLVLSGSLLSFLLVNIFLYFGLYRIRETVETKNEELGEEAAEYTGQMVEAEIKKRMGEITRLRAKHVDLGLMATAADVIYSGCHEYPVEKGCTVLCRASSQCIICRRSCRSALYSLQSGSCKAGCFAGFTA